MPETDRHGDTKHSGALELTWTNKHLSLLAHEDGLYEWVPPQDWRVSEVRLLDDVEAFGEVRKRRSSDNLLIEGDALNALKALTDLREFAGEYAGNVRLCYIDPPFNTRQSFLHYDDALEHSVWLTMMRDRLLQVHVLLSDNGSVWVHLDDAESHRARCVLDEVFGPANFITEVIWESSDSPRNDAGYFSRRHNSILVYAKNRETLTFNRYPLDLANLQKHYNKVDEEGRAYYLKPLRFMGVGDARERAPNLFYAMRDPDGSDVFPTKSDGTDGYWTWSAKKVAAEKQRIEWVEARGGGGHGTRTIGRTQAQMGVPLRLSGLIKRSGPTGHQKPK